MRNEASFPTLCGVRPIEASTIEPVDAPEPRRRPPSGRWLATSRLVGDEQARGLGRDSDSSARFLAPRTTVVTPATLRSCSGRRRSTPAAVSSVRRCQLIREAGGRAVHAIQTVP